MVAIVKYNAGNTCSVQNALSRLGVESVITNTRDIIMNADKVIFPGVGHAEPAMEFLKAKQLDELICSITKPFLGICLGLQLLCKHSAEGNTKCLGVFNNEVKAFPASDIVPHIGWNCFTEVSGHLFEGINSNDDVYYVHSYYAETNENTVASCDYILPFSAALQKNNFYATQFHPEKSGQVGEKILKNFLSL